MNPGVHRSLAAKTRLGDDSVIAIPIFPEDGLDRERQPDFRAGKAMVSAGSEVSRVGVVKKLRRSACPKDGKSRRCLRNCHAWVIDTAGRWEEDTTVRLDDDLGVVYEAKEAE